MNFLVDSFVTGGAFDWIGNILVKICMLIDSIIYKALAAIYEIFMALCRLNLSSFGDMFENLTKRLYLILGIVMLFVISFNLLKMLVEPDKANDSNIGGPAMAKHIFLSLVMLIAFPYVFDLLDEAQNAILDGNVIETIVLGDGASSLSGPEAGPSFSWTLLSSFFRPSDGSEWSSSNSFLSTKAKEAYNEIWVTGSDGKGTYSLGQLASVASDSTVDYTFIVSTIIGIVVAIQLLKFCITVGKRAFKLLFLQLLAPIPVISYMDPNKGTKVFNSYVSEYISTYVELFINIFILFLGILLANKVMILFQGSSMNLIDTSNLSWFGMALAKALIVIAIFKFADEVPNMFNSIFGTKFKGTNGAFGKALAGAVGFAGGAAIGAAGALGGSIARGEFKPLNLKDENGQRTVGSVLNGIRGTAGSIGKIATNTVGGAARGGYGGSTSGYKSGISAKGLKAMGAAGLAGVAAQHNSSIASTEAGGFFQKQFGRLDRATGGEYRVKKNLDNKQNELKDSQSKLSAFDGIRSAAERQYAANNGKTIQEMKDMDGTSYEANLANFIDHNQSNAAIMAAVSEYNTENKTSMNVSDFTAQYSAAKTDVSNKKQSLDNYKKTHHVDSRQKAMNATGGSKK